MLETPLAGRVAVALEGDPIDLDNACRIFGKGGEIRICRLHIPPNDKVVLLSPDLNQLTDDEKVFSTAERMVGHISGLLFLRDRARKPLIMQGIVHRQSANGNWGTTIAVGAVHLTLRAHAIFDSNDIQPSRDMNILQNALTDEPVSEVLMYLRGEAGWFDLYKAFEIIRKDSELKKNKHPEWWPDAQHFRSSANFYRHSSAKRRPNDPKDESEAMPLREAKDFIRSLCTRWLEWRDENLSA